MQPRFALIPLAAALCAAGAAQAQTSPYYIGVGQAFNHQVGVLTSSGETTSVTTLRGGVQRPLGRGRVYADGSLSHTRFSSSDDLNSTGHDLSGGLDWATVGTLSGSFSGLSSQQLMPLTDCPLPCASGLRNQERTTDAEARLRLGTAGPLGFNGGVGARRVDYSAPEFDDREYRQHRANLGGTYRVGGALTLGAGAAVQESTYPRFAESLLGTPPGTFTPDHAKRREAYVLFSWVPTGASAFDGRISATRVTHDVSPDDFSGVTGFVSWNWRPTGKLRFVTSLARETVEETNFSTVAGRVLPAPGLPGATEPPLPTPTVPGGPTAPVGTGFQGLSTLTGVVNRLSLRATWDATAKIIVSAGLVHSRQTATAPPPAITGSNVTTATLGARWTPTRALTFGCDINNETRSNAPTGRSFGCSGEFMLR